MLWKRQNPLLNLIDIGKPILIIRADKNFTT